MSDISSTVALSDAAMADEFLKAKGEVLVVLNGFTAAIATRAKPNEHWVPFARGDFGDKASKAAKKLASAKRLYWQEVDYSPAAFAWDFATPIIGTFAVINTWIADAKKLTGGSGRGLGLSTKVENAFGLEAKWRCQFAGCGKNLMKQMATGVASKSSYFAHIIASSPKGPRGSPMLSHALAHDVNNYMLLCDECHRRIDREDPDRFTVDVLRKMRRDSLIEVERLLDSLTYKEAIPIAIMGNIAGQSPQVDWRDVEEGLWTRRLRMAPGHPYTFMENGWAPHDAHSEYYWNMLLHGMGAELPQLRKLLATNPSAPGNGKHFAILPVHSTSALVLAGRIFGEAASATILQFRRQFSKGQWSIGDEDAQTPPAQFKLIRHREPNAADTEACLMISLTFAIGTERLSGAIHDGDFKMPTLEITAEPPLTSTILDDPQNLEALSLFMSEAVRILQDDWKMKKVHLVIGAPVSGVFKFGQKLQARNQATYVCYETPLGEGVLPFKPTIEIAGHGVRAVGNKHWLGFV